MAETGQGGKRSLRIGKYEVLSHIATGGMGAVYKAVDPDLGREVALKVLSPEIAHKPNMVERFRREARSAAKLRHENIVAIYEVGEAAGTHFIALEFVEGIDLHEYITSRQRLEPEEARQLLLQAARALDHAAGQGIVHRDIKPSNFLLTEKDGKPLLKLTDLGLARQTREDEARLTKVHTTVGTVDYMSPEQAKDSASADIRSDIYSLGCTFYHMLSGNAPFPEGSIYERIYKHVEVDPPDIRTLNPDVPDEYVVILKKMLAKKPENRYQTPRELLNDLEHPENINLLSPLEGEERGAAPAQPARRVREAGAVEKTAVVAKKKPVGESEKTTVIAKKKTDAEAEKTPKKKKGRGRSSGIISVSPLKKYQGLIWAGGALLLGVIALIVWWNVRDGKPEVEPAPITKGKPKPEPPKENPKEKIEPKPDSSAGKMGPLLPASLCPEPPDREALWAKFVHPLEPFPEADAKAVILRVNRSAVTNSTTFQTLGEALGQAPADRLTVIEIHDNGPLWEPSLPELTGRRLWLRPGPGYRPLLVWDVDVPAGKKASPDRFLSLSQGDLVLEDLDVVVQWHDVRAKVPACWFAVKGNVFARGCTFSTAGMHPHGIDVVRVAPANPGVSAKCWLSRCYARGAQQTLVRASGKADVLLESCLGVSGEAPLLAARPGENETLTLRLVRSTFLAGKTVVLAQPAPVRTARVACWTWDTLLARHDTRSDGALIKLANGISLDQFKWQAVNCVYAGWNNLLAGEKVFSGRDLKTWREQWNYYDGDKDVEETWPKTPIFDPEEMPAADFENPPFAYGATSASGLLGCVVGVLPEAPQRWLRRTYQRYPVKAPELLTDADEPEIPRAGDGFYAGEVVDLAKDDLGQVLQTRLQTLKPAATVVMHLVGTGDRPISPVLVKGIERLVLYVKPPAKEKVAPLTLVPDPAGAADREALFDVQDGSLDVIGARVVFKNTRFVPKFMFRVQEGNLRLAKCTLEGPMTQAPDHYGGLIHCLGGGRKNPSVSGNESILLSGNNLLTAQGGKAHVRFKQCVLLGAHDGFHIHLDAPEAGQLPFYGLLENNTIACRRHLVHLDDLVKEAAGREPVLWQTTSNLFLDPFGDAGRQSALLRCPPHLLARGQLLWQGQNNGFDHKRLAAYARFLPGGSEVSSLPTWQRLWGLPNEHKPFLVDLPTTDKFTVKMDAPKLDRLALPPQLKAAPGESLPGANLVVLKILKKK